MTAPAAGDEPWAPVALASTSVTERAAFRRCRRQWFLSTVHRLERPGGNANFWFGELVHKALEGYYRSRMAGAPHAPSAELGLSAFRAAHVAVAGQGRRELGFLWPEYAQEYADALALGEAMLGGYFHKEEKDPIGRPTAVETRYHVPIPGPVPGVLSGRLDLEVERPNGDEFVVDHKTAAQAANSAQLDLDDQLTGYAWLKWRTTRRWPRGQVYNTLVKKAPHKPALLKRGGLSQDKGQLTTYKLYVEAIREHGLALSDYSDMLKYLRERPDPFFIREGVFRTPGQVAEFERNLQAEWADMVDVAARPERAYPNPSPFNCPSCPVRQICAAMMDGGEQDAAALVRANFRVGDPRE